MATMRDVAIRAGVSIATVSFVVNNTKRVAPDTRSRIIEAMNDLHYQRNVVARALASHRTRIIALLYPALDHRAGPTIMKFITKAASVAQERGYDFVLWPVSNDAKQMSHLLAGGLVDGVILMEVQINDARVDKLVESNTPFALIGRTHDESLPFVDIDFSTTLEQALDYFTELGHSHIAFVSERTPNSILDDIGPLVRTASAYRDGMVARGLEQVVVYCEGSPHDGRQAARDVLAADPETTAVIVMNENAAFGVVSGFKHAGLSVPEDVSVLSIATSSEMGALSDPILSTMNAPAAELGELGVAALIDLLEGTVEHPPHVLLACPLVLGESTGPAPDSAAVKRRST
jgi:DNA-binding LacI/PurR family transcriptional regulator